MQTALVLCLLFGAASAVHHQPQASSDFSQSVPVSSIEGASYPGAVFEHGFAHSNAAGGQAQPNFYSPTGVIQVVGSDPKAVSSQQGVVGSSVASAPGVARYSAVAGEQYGQPESQALPANYKPFGSWGLYIGGNPADGYYSNYYKSLGDKQQAVGSVSGVEQASGGVVKPIAPSSGAYAPIQRQAFVGGSVAQPSGSFVGSEYYPIAYSPAELNSMPAPASNGFVSPVHAGAQIYGTPASFDSSLAYASPESYANVKGAKVGQSKGVAAAAVAQESYKEVQQQQAPVKGVVSRYAYGAMPQQYQPQAQAHQQQQQQFQHQQVVAYPVPVGSQMVGSQAGVEGAFQPYGVHAFTKYAVKPAVVAANGPPAAMVDSGAQQHSYSYYQYPSYKAQGASAVNALHQAPGYQPFSFYGYPIGQHLHYNSASGAQVPMYNSQTGSYVGQQSHEQHQASPVMSAAPVASVAGSSSSSVSAPVAHSSGSSVAESPVVVSEKHAVEGVQKDKSEAQAQ